MSIESKLRMLATMGAGWVMWLLLALSVVVVAIAVERGIVLVLTRGNIRELRRELASALGRGDLLAARRCVVTSRSVEAQVLAAGLGALPRGAAAVEERMASEAQLARLVLEERLAVLGTVGSNAPFVGLLGTVIGIIAAFQAIGASGAGGLGTVSVGIAEALIETALGLSVAIPAVILFNYLTHRVTSIESALGRSAGQLIDEMEYRYGRQEEERDSDVHATRQAA
jgi:biopolymer transport protein ExbB/TolQ